MVPAAGGGAPVFEEIEMLHCSSRLACAFAASLAVWMAQAQGENPADDMSALMSFDWNLREAHSRSGEPRDIYFPPTGRPLVLAFETQGSFSVVGDCNRFGGGFVLSGGRICKEPSPQSLRTATLMGCDFDRLATDAAIVELMNDEPRYRIRDTVRAQGLPVLELEAESGDRLVFEGRPTLLERFGSRGQRIELEVQPAFVRCPRGSPRSVECLRAREVRAMPAAPIPGHGYFDYRFEAQEAWRTLEEEIEGFAPRGGVSLVIGALRFEPDLLGSGRSKAAYVFTGVFAGDGWIDDWEWRNSHATWVPPPATVLEAGK
jgi:heat shock protein HslJ